MRAEDISPQLRFFYQPVIARAEHAVTLAEASVLWTHAELGLVNYPLAFQGCDVPEIDAVTSFIVEQVLTDLPRLKRMYGQDCGVAVPIDATQLTQPDTVVQILGSALSHHEISAGDLHVVLSADAVGQIFEPQMVQAFGALRSLGVRVILGEFGIGMMTLAGLGEIVFDAIKVDDILVQRMIAHAATRGLVAGIGAFCANADVDLIAGGVNDAMILNELERLGCVYVQGELFGDPVEIEGLRPRVYPLVAKRLPNKGQSKTPTQAQIASIRKRITELSPRTFRFDFPEFFEHAQNIVEEISHFRPEHERTLRCEIGREITTAAVMSGETLVALDWGLETSNLAEDLGRPGLSAEMLALISTMPATTESTRFVRFEALSRALQIRATSDLDPTHSGILDNILGIGLAHLGLNDRAIAWWNNSVRENENTDYPGDTYAAINLAEAELSRLECPTVADTELRRQSTLRRLDRAVARVQRSAHTPEAVAESLSARNALISGDIDRALQLFGPWSTQQPKGIVPVFEVLRTRAVLARSIADSVGYLAHTAELVEQVADTSLMRHHRRSMMLLRIDALAGAGRHEEALDIQQELLVYEQEIGRRRISAMFDWMQIRVDVDLEFAHYAGFARRPELADPY